MPSAAMHDLTRAIGSDCGIDVDRGDDLADLGHAQRIGLVVACRTPILTPARAFSLHDALTTPAHPRSLLLARQLQGDI